MLNFGYYLMLDIVALIIFGGFSIYLFRDLKRLKEWRMHYAKEYGEVISGLEWIHVEDVKLVIAFLVTIVSFITSLIFLFVLIANR